MNLSTTIPTLFSSLCLLGILCGAPMAAEETSSPSADLEAIREAQASPITLHLDRRMVTGSIDFLSGDGVEITQILEGGEVSFLIPWQDIRAVSFPDERFLESVQEWAEAGQWGEALQIMEVLYSYRRPFFGILSEEERQPFLSAVRWSVQAGFYPQVIGWVSELQPHFEGPDYARYFLEAEMEAFLGLEMWDEADSRAREWIEATPLFGDTALGWVIFARILQRNESIENALVAALQPIVFSSQLPVQHLNQSYALAAELALQLEDRAYARLLFDEMADRELAWPPERTTGFRTPEAFLIALDTFPEEETDPFLEESGEVTDDAEAVPDPFSDLVEAPEEDRPLAPRTVPGSWLPRTRLPSQPSLSN